MTSQELKQIIFETFKDVPKGEGLGVRECAALDDYASEEEQTKVRALDVEQNWWEYPDKLKEFDFDYALTYNNEDGIKFHLPALMTAAIDGMGNTADISVYRVLCLASKQKRPPHHGHREYVGFLKSINVRDTIKYYNFTPEQIHAIALYLLWYMKEGFYNHFFDSREKMIATVTHIHELCQKHAGKGNYTLTLDDAIAIVDEEYRIVRDWFKAGGVDWRK